MKKTKQLLKQKRHRQYEEINEEMSSVGLNLSEIKIEDFVESRKKELAKFQDILKHKFSTKHGHQLLPHHMRRRQMSHNPFRIPRLFRVSNLTVNVKSKCRKHKRKLMNLKRSLIRRARRQNWLEGHLWLAKRFFMKKYLDTYTIPYKRRDKGYRACYKYWEHYCVIHDMSYYDYFVINVLNDKEEQFFELLLKKYSIGNDINNFKEQMLLNKITLYDNEGRIIGPIEFFYFNNIFVILNVSIITNQIYDLLDNISKEMNNSIEIKFTHKFNLFVLGGKTCLSKILSVFSESNIDININSTFNNLNEKESLINKIQTSQDGKMIIFKIKQPISIFKLNEHIYINCLNDNNPNKNEKMKSLFLNSSINESNLNKEFIDLIYSNTTDYLTYKEKFLENDKIEEKKEDNKIQEIKDEYFNFEEITERTTFMHRKKVDLKKLNNTLSKSIKDLKKNKDKQNTLTQPKKEIEKNYIKGKVYKKEEIKDNILSSHDKDTYICLIKKNIYYYDYNEQLKISSLYYLIFPRGYSIDLMRRFSYINTKAIGLRDLERFKTQYNQTNFPRDYPGSLAYQKYILEKTKKELVKYYKKPPSKRVNYLKILNPSPFYSCWELLFNNDKENKNTNIYNSSKNINIIPSIKLLSDKNYLNQLMNITKNNGKKFLLSIEILTVEGGTINYNDLLYIPKEEDIQKYLLHKKNKNDINDIIFEEKNDEQNNEMIDEEIDYIKEYEDIKNNFKIIEEIKDKNLGYGQMTKNKYFNNELVSLMKYYSKPNSNQEQDFYNNIINSNLTIKLKVELSRKLIGFITTGLYDYSLNKGKARGFIKVQEYEKLCALKQKFNMNFMPILLRKKDSLVYYLCSICFH